MGITSFLKSLFGRKSSCRIPLEINNITQTLDIHETAFHACVNLIANALTNCTVKVFKEGNPVKDLDWYRLNYQPNVNQSAKEFWKKLIHRLYEDNEALVVIRDDGLYVADSFVKNDQFTFFPHTYEGVTIGQFQYSYSLTEKDVLYFKLHDVDMKDLTDQVAGLYIELIQAFASAYISANGSKGILNINQIAEQQDDFEETINRIVNEDFKAFYGSTNAVMPLFDGYEYIPFQNESGLSKDSKEVRDQVKAIFETYAMAFGIPKNLITGEVRDTTEAIEAFLTFTLDPLVKTLESEINRKSFTKNELEKGYRIQFKTNEIKHIDILSVAANIEKLISSGAMTINEVRKASGMDKIDRDFADEFFMTKNFANIENLLDQLERRDTNEGTDTGQDESPVS